MFARSRWISRQQEDAYCHDAGREIHSEQGGHGAYLGDLFLYDAFVFLLALSLVGVTLLMEPESNADGNSEWRVYSQLYWIRVLTGYLAFPFLIFKIPGLNKLLMHTSRTGYNRFGMTVPVIKMFTLPGQHQEDPSSAGDITRLRSAKRR